jgi:hypothetical protein
MELSTVVIVVVIIAVAVLALKLLGKALSFLLSILGIVAVVWVLVFGLRYMDERDLRSKFLESTNLYVLADGENIITGYATDGTVPAINKVDEIKGDPAFLDEYYKVVVVNAESLPERTAAIIAAADESDKILLLKSYMNKTILSGDAVDNLISAEQEGTVEVYKNTLAFKHGLREVLTNT